MASNKSEEDLVAEARAEMEAEKRRYIYDLADRGQQFLDRGEAKKAEMKKKAEARDAEDSAARKANILPNTIK
ncbi:hypothetical protein CSOJ01_12222 [Colletotrichum sojae]|uniref:Uncharacterized protein n=1 Tax=Colletotrichum sojae TaxID=2175907 RepID=A0A8H6MLV1_9PEZI|nr:hypothetical protein CSOJ01_12222 [Colletotrichum sojae]